jgi:hypothetical protein
MHVNPKKIAEETCVISQIEHSLNKMGRESSFETLA